MRLFVTGCDGYVGSVLCPILAESHEVVGLDVRWFRPADDSWFVPPLRPWKRLVGDVRDLTPKDLQGFDAVIHLAAIAADYGQSIPAETYAALNRDMAVCLAEQAREAGVPRFVFASTASVYGHTEVEADERHPLAPLTPYGEAKAEAERAIRLLQVPCPHGGFRVTILRCATVYGLSPALRMDLMVQDFAKYAVLHGEVKLLSDGEAWRPLIHVEDLAHAYRELIELHACGIFNVTAENIVVKDAANRVASAAGVRVTVDPDGGPDKRSYRLNGIHMGRTVPLWSSRWKLSAYAPLLIHDFLARSRAELEAPELLRVKCLMKQMEEGKLDAQLRRI